MPRQLPSTGQQKKTLESVASTV